VRGGVKSRIIGGNRKEGVMGEGVESTKMGRGEAGDRDKRRKRYERLLGQFRELQVKSRDMSANMATLNALIYFKLPEIFWVGFYFVRGEELVVHSYQGPLACQTLPRGRGVCWAAVEAGETVFVEDVHAFPGHIACDGRSNSEIVVPVRDASGEVIGCLDIDSRAFGRFDEVDAEGLEALVGCIGF